jgi:hypothetical protein
LPTYRKKWAPRTNDRLLGWPKRATGKSKLEGKEESNDMHCSGRRSQACTCHQSLFASRAQRFTALPVVRGLSFARFEWPALRSVELASGARFTVDHHEALAQCGPKAVYINRYGEYTLL